MNPFTGGNNVQLTISSPTAATDQNGRNASGVITWNTGKGVTVTFDPVTGEVRFPVNLKGAGNLRLQVTDQLGASSSVAVLPFSVAGTVIIGNPTAATVTAGTSANFTVDSDSHAQIGFNGKAVFTCTPTQQMVANGISCSFSSAPPGASGATATLFMNNGAAYFNETPDLNTPPVQLNLLVNTTAHQIGALIPASPIGVSANPDRNSARLLLAMLATTGLPVFGVVLVGGIRRRNWKLVLLAVALATLVMLSACGGVNSFKPNNTTVSGTQSGTYQVVVSATYTPTGSTTSTTESRTYTVTVQ